ncbi:Nif3-like dinuclear metal center hexameric protein [Prolixibacteraceae bacterium Z1-6]|uniref:Nif3-like dinuclear metal center hexameric protein n=1 Tax=Draconibacterium aestuarii TaxID=2998507 RepID=A0A9X3F476_9BACT|nr:Nif3-like dinuclear metal center hexameric protein [Prolixibacteraceae bacterium Z1-6]
MRSILIILFIIPLFSFAQKAQTPENIVDLIKKNVTCQWQDETVDTFKAGDPKSEITGIAVCMFADMATLQRAVEMNCNFIITHEPIFYSHLDETDTFTNDPVYLEKRKFIEDNKLTVFRFHDHIHSTSPDGIYEGMLNKLGWRKYAVKDSPLYFKMPKTNISDFAEQLKEKLGLESIRLVGNGEMEFTKVGLAVGAPGGPRHIKMLRQDNVEVMVAGEASEWETYSYVNDAAAQGKTKAVLFLGHVKSEEAGMEYCAEWLQGFVKDTPIHFIENELNFTEL